MEETLLDKYSYFINIINEEIDNIIGYVPELTIHIQEYDNIHSICFCGIIFKICNESIFLIRLDKNKKLLLTNPNSKRILKLNSELIFRDYTIQIINEIIKREVKKACNHNIIKNEPEKLKNYTYSSGYTF